MDGDFKFMDHYWKGAVSGMTGIIISHPIDTIKTHIQNGSKVPRNFKSLMTGIRAPLIGVGFEKAIVFGTYNLVNNYLTRNAAVNSYVGDNNALKKPNSLHTAISGAVAGFSASLIVTPYERIKILRQTGQNIQNFNVGNLFKGLNMTFTREVPGFAIYFTVYENLKYYTLRQMLDSNTNSLPLYLSFVYGGISGSIAWVFIYPQDRIKTIIQSANTSTSIKFDDVKNIIRILSSGGVRSLYSGFSYALIRAVALHSGTFAMMELLNR
jgi:hypothetical protein